jgi:hypothetical protein
MEVRLNKNAYSTIDLSVRRNAQMGIKMKKKLAYVMMVMILLLSFAACSENKSEDTAGDSSNEQEGISEEVTQSPEEDDSTAKDLGETQEFQQVNISAAGWTILLENYMRDTSMKNAATVLGYTDTTTTEFVQEAPEGKEYFLIKLKLEKDDSKENVQWDKVTLTDQENQVYYRTEDVFIEDLGMKRVPGTDLNFGSNEGWIAFEINEGAKGLKLTIQFDDAVSEYTFD